MKNRDALITYLVRAQAKALVEAAQMGEPEPEHWAVAALLDELEALGLVRVPAQT
jgi:hypothetical protein